MIEDLVVKLKKEIIDQLQLEGLAPEEVDPEAPLFGDEGLGLDSIDVLELVVLLDENYGIKIRAPKEEGPNIFYSVRTIAEYIMDYHKEIKHCSERSPQCREDF
jgi:acyl carrier protein